MKKQCNFCGRNEKDVKLLITGINGYICENCIEQAYRILQESGMMQNQNAQSNGNGKFRLKNVTTWISMSLGRTRPSAIWQ